MEKFSKKFEAKLIPEWKEAFVNYWYLKKQVKKIKISRKIKNPQEYFLKRKSMEDGESDEEVYQTELVQLFREEDEVGVFFERLDEELNKVNQFYDIKESEFVERGEPVNNNHEILMDLKRILSEMDREPNTVLGEFINRKEIQRAEEMIRCAFVELYKGLALLKTYSSLNRVAFKKILKKFDKVADQKASATNYLKVVKTSHFISSDKVVTLMDDVESIFTKHFANNDRKKTKACLTFRFGGKKLSGKKSISDFFRTEFSCLVNVC